MQMANGFAQAISIHAPRTGSDTKRLEALEGRKKFQSTLPARGATVRELGGKKSTRISIHAPRTGSDAFPCLVARAYSNFNPRSPHGERLLFFNT